MPASSIDLYYMQDARNNFDAIRPAPVCSDANQFVGQCQNIHISKNCYYGYHDPTSAENAQVANTTDFEMMDLQLEPAQNSGTASASPQSNARKRTAEDGEYPDSKRLREEVQRENTNEPETTESMPKSDEHLLESLYWNIHGGNIYHLIQCL